MPIGTSDGEYFDNHFESMVEGNASKAGSSTASRMPPEASTEPAGALNPDAATLPPARSVLDKLTGRDGGERYQTWPEKVVRDAWSALKLPGEVMSGEASPNDIERVNNLAGLMVLGPAPLAKKMVDGTLGSFAGVRSQGIKSKLADLGYAQVLESNGIHADDIFTTTGFFRGADKRWRYEIDDSKAKFFPENIKQGAFLSDVYSHSELFEAYPDLKYVKVFTDPKLAGAEAQAQGAKPYINLGEISMNDGRVAAKDKGILMHEVQHMIQQYEDFAKGATFTGHASDSPAVQYYIRSAGEVEARNVDTRLNLDVNRRRTIPPDWSEDTARSRQIITRGVGLANEQGLEDAMTGALSKSADVLENAATSWAQGKMTNKEFREFVQSKGWHMDKYELQRSRKSTVDVFDPDGKMHELTP